MERTREIRLLAVLLLLSLHAGCNDGGNGNTYVQNGKVYQVLDDGDVIQVGRVNQGGGYNESGAGWGTLPPDPDWMTDGSEGLESAQLGLYALNRAENCEQAMSIWKEAAIEKMKETLAYQRHRILHPESCWDEYYTNDCMAMDTAAGGDWGGGEEEDEEGASEYSTTNTQEVGVDEADFVKNDGSYIYILADGAFQIIDAWPPDQAHKISETDIKGTPRKMFIYKDRAVIYSSTNIPYNNWNECTYGYDCEFTGDGSELEITVLDISDLEQPEVLRRTHFEGSYLSSRRIEDFIYTMVYTKGPTMPLMKSVPDALQQYLWECSDTGPLVDPWLVDALFTALYHENLEIIEAVTLEGMIPEVSDVDLSGDSPHNLGNPLTDCSSYYLSQTGDGQDLISLVSFDLTKQEPAKASSIVARPGALYGSKQALYLATRHYKTYMTKWFDEYSYATDATSVHKFLLAADSPDTTYTGSGLVQGRVLNQFSMSEHKGDLRMATTSGWNWSSENAVVVLRPEPGQGLVQVGSLTGLANGEDIRAVRFAGDLGFVVTFYETDPLYVIDLSDPEHPAAKGELHIPGFSTYMHFMDKQHLLSIGLSGEWSAEIMLQVFDVSDITKPTLMHKKILSSGESESEAAVNHLAFNYFKPKNLIAIPLDICHSWWGDNESFRGLMLYHVTVEDGFSEIGGLPHSDGYSDCGWNWTQQDSTVKRSVVMDDWIFSVAEDEIKVAEIENPSQVLADVDLTD